MKTELNEYYFEFQRKITAWQKTDFCIEASSQAEADEKARIFIKSKDFEYEYGFTTIDDSEVVMTYEQNNNSITEELYDNETGLPIYDNRPVEVKRNEKLKLLGI
jgi:hypothetical protein